MMNIGKSKTITTTTIIRSSKKLLLLLSLIAAAVITTGTIAAEDIDFDTVDPDELRWERRSSLPTTIENGEEETLSMGVHHPITFSNGTHGFVLTGTTNDESYTNIFYVYEESTDTWTDLSDTEYAFPGKPRSFGYGVSSSIADTCSSDTENQQQQQSQKAYLGFGAAWNDEWEFENDDTNQPFELKLNDWWEFDMNTMTWKELAPFPGRGRRHPAMNYVVGDEPSSVMEIHVGLGDGEGGNYNDWWSYSILDNEWTQLSDFPSSARHHPFHFSIGTDSYVGLGHSSVVPYIERDWYKWDTIQQKWFEIGDFASYDIGSSGSWMYPQTTEARVAGTQFSVSSCGISNDDGSSNTGSTVAAMARAAPSSSPTTTTLGFVLSGDGDDHRTMEEGEFHVFDPTAGRGTTSAGTNKPPARYWRMLPPHPGFSRWAPGSFVLGQRAYMIGGYDRRTGILHGDVWTIDLKPLFKDTAAENNQVVEDDDWIDNVINDVVQNNNNNIQNDVIKDDDDFTSDKEDNGGSSNGVGVNSDQTTAATVNDEITNYNSYDDSGSSGTTTMTVVALRVIPVSAVLSSIFLLLGLTIM